jgi:hypothetical protein
MSEACYYQKRTICSFIIKKKKKRLRLTVLPVYLLTNNTQRYCVRENDSKTNMINIRIIHYETG